MIMTFKFKHLVYYLCILFFFTGFNFSDKFQNGWQMQTLPNLNGKLISGVTFLDTLTGFLITNNDTSTDSCYIIKTTNGGLNWSNKLTFKGGLSKIHFIDFFTGYASGGTNSGTSKLYKTTNTGNNWFLYNSPSANFFTDMSFANKDTFWLADDDGLIGGLFRSTDGGLTWQNQYYSFNQNPDKIYMVNKNLGFMSRNGSYTGRTINGGENWQITPDDSAFRYIAFADSLNGWKSFVNLQKTTDGGQTWFWQKLPIVPGASYNHKIAMDFYTFNRDTVFAVGGGFAYGNTLEKGLVYKTTNGGLNWGYQIPDTSYGILGMNFITFVTERKGWAFSVGLVFISPHKYIFTISGGDDTTYYTGITNGNQIIPDDYVLYQNYPNPFNSVTRIKYKILNSTDIKIVVYDIMGKEVRTLINKKQSAGTYEISFDGNNLSSGIYYYNLMVEDERISTRKMLMIK